MPFTTLSLGLTLTIPTNGTTNWGTTVRQTTWTKISQHTHTGSGDGNQMVTGSYSDNSITTVKLSKNYGWTQAAQVSPSGTTQDLDLDLGNVQDLDLASASGDVTVTLSNPAQGSMYWVFMTQGVTARDVIWPASVKWAQGQKPILSTTNGAVDAAWLYYDGTEFRGDWQLDYK